MKTAILKTSISRHQLETADFQDLTTGENLPPIHPGEILREEFLIPLGLSAHALAMALQVPAPRINDIARGRRGITADTALRLAKYFGTSPEFWANLQTHFEMECARASMKEILNRITRREATLTIPA